MNFITFFPKNQFINYPFQQQLYYVQPNVSTYPVLPYLKYALQQSLASFQPFFHQNNVQNVTESSEITVESEKNLLKYQNGTNRKELIEKDQVMITEQIKIGHMHGISPRIQDKVENQFLSIVNTDDQHHVQNIKQQSSASKNQKKNILKEEKVSKKKESKISLPQIDLIQTAYIPSMTITTKEILQKKKRLLKRKVQGKWDSKVKNHSEKRQIRMLNN